MSTAIICDYCDERITDRTTGIDGVIRFDHRTGGDREPEYVADTLHFHRRCLEALRGRAHRWPVRDKADEGGPSNG